MESKHFEEKIPTPEEIAAVQREDRGLKNAVWLLLGKSGITKDMLDPMEEGSPLSEEDMHQLHAYLHRKLSAEEACVVSRNIGKYRTWRQQYQKIIGDNWGVGPYGAELPPEWK